MQATEMNRHMCMWSERTILQNSGSIPSDYNVVVDLPGQTFAAYNALSTKTTRNSWRHGMATSIVEISIPEAEHVAVTDDTLTVDLSDGRTLSVPLAWFPRLVHASPAERDNWRLIGKGHGIHWEDLDEDISIEGLIAGKPSGESQVSFQQWVQGRASRLT
jgi:hypothetical protein